ncbi:hypothetical protein [Caloramator sp. ALD01]|uniref:hypothetical protein n=1 Tax=Caloramator sp. ALD01 TaxID=1031288 RepID=UPI000413E2BD|nr:hypothetical protein [Caloramator sp. ALD01]
MQREERTRRENSGNRNFRENRKDVVREIIKKYCKSAIPRIDVLIDIGTLENGKIIDNIEKNWSTLFEDKFEFDRKVVEDYLFITKFGNVRYKKNELDAKSLEYILIDTAIKKAIIDSENANDVTVEKVLEYINDLVVELDEQVRDGYIKRIINRYIFNAENEEYFKRLRVWFKNYENHINQFLENAKEKIIDLRKENNVPAVDEANKGNIEVNEQEVGKNQENEVEQDTNKDIEIEELKERLNLFEIEYKRLNKKIEDLNRALDEQKKNIVAELINTLNEKSFGLVLDRLYMWSFMDAEYDINDIKLYIKNLFRALEKLDVYADNSNLLGIIDLQADEIGTKYRLNKDMGAYSPGYKKVIFPGWKYKDEHIINPMIEV